MEPIRFFLEVEQIAELAEKYSDKPVVLHSVLKELKPSPEITYLMTLSNMCETYSCLPKDILEEDAYFLRAFQAIMKGRSKAQDGAVRSKG